MFRIRLLRATMFRTHEIKLKFLFAIAVASCICTCHCNLLHICT
uniref:Uncharacterized protein n=1 Tax=Arundo donax TaxID=35708 RepID=A0A0A9E5F6_ARUDO